MVWAEDKTWLAMADGNKIRHYSISIIRTLRLGKCKLQILNWIFIDIADTTAR